MTSLSDYVKKEKIFPVLRFSVRLFALISSLSQVISQTKHGSFMGGLNLI